jgi:membrane protein
MIDRVRRLLAKLDRWSSAHRSTRIARRAIGGFLAHEGLQYAGSMAYFAVLSIFQLLVLGIVIGSYVLGGQGAARDFVIDQVVAGSPLDAETVSSVIDAAIASRGSMTVIGFAFLVWSALGIFSALSSGIGRVFENAPPRPFVKDKLLGLLLMALTGLLAGASLAIGIITGILEEAASAAVGNAPGGGMVIRLIGFAVPILLILLAFWVIYRIVPNRPVTWSEVLPGAVVAAILWTLLRVGFTWYATSVANYESAFGPLSTGVTLLVFLYFAGVVILIGAEVARASALEDERLAMTADPRLLPVPVSPPPPPAPPSRRGIPGPVGLGVAALIGALIGRLTKRDDG